MLCRIVGAIVVLQLAAGLVHGSTISIQGGGGPGSLYMLMPNTAGQVLTLLISGTDYYSAANVQMTMNWGFSPAPVVTAVFGDDGGSIPAANLAGSVWAGGGGGVSSMPNGTWPGSSGLTVRAGFQTPGFVAKNTQGIFATLTISTVGAPLAGFKLDFTGTTLTRYDEEFNEFAVPLVADPIYLGWGFGEVTASPAPSSPIVIADNLLPGAAAELQDAISLTNLDGSSTFPTTYLAESATITGPDAALFSIIGGFSPSLVTFEEFTKFGIRFAGAMAPGTYTANVQFTFDGGNRDLPPISYPLVVNVVPEPSTHALLALGVACVGAIRSRKRR
jgi:hypothetical protein